MSIFDCSADPAGYSYQNIVEAVAASDIGVPPSSSLRDIPQPYHGWGQAVDFSNGDDWGTPSMDALARWVAATYGPYCLEIIHVYQNGTTEEWKFGVKQPTGWYGWETLNGHKNHVHFAITNAGLASTPIHVSPPAPPRVVLPTDSDWSDMATAEEIGDLVEARIRKVLNEGTAHGQPNWAHTSQAVLAQEQANYNQLRNVAGGIVRIYTELSKG